VRFGARLDGDDQRESEQRVGHGLAPRVRDVLRGGTRRKAVQRERLGDAARDRALVRGVARRDVGAAHREPGGERAGRGAKLEHGPAEQLRHARPVLGEPGRRERVAGPAAVRIERVERPLAHADLSPAEQHHAVLLAVDEAAFSVV
jgi:hypothetical protein